MRYLRLLATYFRLGILGELEYRINFWFQILETIFALVLILGSVSVVFYHTDTLGGWLPDQLIALVGIYITIRGVISLVIGPSLERFVQNVRNGKLDYILIKPVDAQFMVSIQQVQIWKMTDIFAGIILLIIGVVRLGNVIGWLQALVFFVTLICGGIIFYSVWIILATTAFWIVRAENIFQVFNSFVIAGRWPVGIYPDWMRLILTFVVPVAFAITIPAEGIVGRLNTNSLLLSIGVAIGIFTFSRLFWLAGLKQYSGASA